MRWHSGPISLFFKSLHEHLLSTSEASETGEQMLKKTPGAHNLWREWIYKQQLQYLCSRWGQKAMGPHEPPTGRRQYSMVVDSMGSGAMIRIWISVPSMCTCPWGNCTDSKEELHIPPLQSRNHNSACLRGSVGLNWEKNFKLNI